jgi:hypothetical protein
MFGANDENEEMMSLEELKAIQRTFWYNMLKTAVVIGLLVGFYLALKR